MRLESRRRAALARVPPARQTRQREKLEPFSFSTVCARALRFCRTWNSPSRELAELGAAREVARGLDLHPPVLGVDQGADRHLARLDQRLEALALLGRARVPGRSWSRPAAARRPRRSSTDRLAVLPSTGGGRIPPRAGQPSGMVPATIGQASVAFGTPSPSLSSEAGQPLGAGPGTVGQASARVRHAVAVRVRRRVVVDDRPDAPVRPTVAPVRTTRKVSLGSSSVSPIHGDRDLYLAIPSALPSVIGALGVEVVVRLLGGLGDRRVVDVVAAVAGVVVTVNVMKSFASLLGHGRVVDRDGRRREVRAGSAGAQARARPRAASVHFPYTTRQSYQRLYWPPRPMYV